MNLPPYVSDPLVRRWALTPCKADLAATNHAGALCWPRLNGKYVVGSYTAPPGTVVLVKAIVPYVQARTNVSEGSTTEGVQMISPTDGGDFFGFEHTISGGQNGGASFKASVPGMDVWAATDNQTDTDIKTPGGIYAISNTPFDTAVRAFDSRAFDIVVAGGQTFSLLFSLVQDGRGPVAYSAGPPTVLGLTSPLPYRYSIGGSVAGTKRVDYAGAIVWGYQMPADHYARLSKAYGLVSAEAQGKGGK